MDYLIIFILIVLNGFFAMAEIAIVSSRKTHLKKMAHDGNKSAESALELANNPNEFLSTVQIGITLTGILAGAFGGAALAEPLAKEIAHIPLLQPFSGIIALIIVVSLITYVSLVIGEIVPKRLALIHSEAIAMRISHIMQFFLKVGKPFVMLLSFSTNILLGLIGIKHQNTAKITDEEVKLLIREGRRTGVFESAEQDIVERTLKLSDKRVNALMTPRSEIDFIDINASFEEIRSIIAKKVHPHYPVCEENLDKVIGIVRTGDVLSNFLLHKKIDLKQSIHKPIFIPESLPAYKLLEIFKKTGIHMALVIDEFGSTQGIITLTDILEEIVGDIPDIEDLEEKDIMKRTDNSWFVNAMVPVDEFKEFFHIRNLPNEKTGDFFTVGGFLMNRLGKIPVPGDKATWENFTFEILDMDENRIDKILVVKSS